MIRRINVKDYDFTTPYNDIKLYKTKKEAEKAAASLGWSNHNIMMLEKRFEQGYFVGQWFIHGENMYFSPLCVGSYKWYKTYESRESHSQDSKRKNILNKLRSRVHNNLRYYEYHNIEDQNF